MIQRCNTMARVSVWVMLGTAICSCPASVSRGDDWGRSAQDRGEQQQGHRVYTKVLEVLFLMAKTLELRMLTS